MKAFIICASAFYFAVMLLVVSHHIDQWERTNGYPFGKMCNSVFTGFADTCRHVR